MAQVLLEHWAFASRINNVEDIVSARLLDQMIASGSIRQFYRTSEQRWIILGADKISG